MLLLTQSLSVQLKQEEYTEVPKECQDLSLFMGGHSKLRRGDEPMQTTSSAVVLQKLQQLYSQLYFFHGFWISLSL